MNKVYAKITYDIFNRDSGYITVTSTGYLDRTRIYKELLKLDLGSLYLEIDNQRVIISSNMIHTIEYTVGGYLVDIDCSPYYRKYYDRKKSAPANIDGRIQPESTNIRERSKTGERKTGKIPYKRGTGKK